MEEQGIWKAVNRVRYEKYPNAKKSGDGWYNETYGIALCFQRMK